MPLLPETEATVEMYCTSHEVTELSIFVTNFKVALSTWIIFNAVRSMIKAYICNSKQCSFGFYIM